jgi:hypothetical protein
VATVARPSPGFAPPSRIWGGTVRVPTRTCAARPRPPCDTRSATPTWRGCATPRRWPRCRKANASSGSNSGATWPHC